MTARQQRRQEEHKARKEAYKAQKQTEKQQPETIEAPRTFAAAAAAAVSPAPACLAAETRPSSPAPRPGPTGPTGPRTVEGKTIASRNAFRHGLAGRFVVLEWEKAEDYYDLLIGLRHEHQPATFTESLLVERMAQHQWLSQRAVFLQRFCFHSELPTCEEEKLLALYIRYGTTHDRAFHKCLSDLLKLRALQARQQREFVSQEHKQAAETRKQELHHIRLQVAQARVVTLKLPAKPRQQAAIPTATPEITPPSLSSAPLNREMAA